MGFNDFELFLTVLNGLYGFLKTNVLKKKPLSLIDGPEVKELEAKMAKLFGKKYCLMVNSGSSANLLALSSLELKKNSEIITPTLTFSTTVSPIYQLNFKNHMF